MSARVIKRWVVVVAAAIKGGVFLFEGTVVSSFSISALPYSPDRKTSDEP
jgi:hypothetical protein